MKERRTVVCLPAAFVSSSSPLSRIHHSGMPRFVIYRSTSPMCPQLATKSLVTSARAPDQEMCPSTGVPCHPATVGGTAAEGQTKHIGAAMALLKRSEG